MENSPFDIAALRKEYILRGLRRSDLDPDPMKQFALWFAEALQGQPVDPNAMTLATVAADGQPSARTVLLKGFDERGFVFFTNYVSRKGRELHRNPRAALHFLWTALERQVCITGTVEKVSREESELYFHSRPLGSQLGAWASTQSARVSDRAQLEAQLAKVAAQYQDMEVPLPPDWGGYRVRPGSVEFWQGRPNRLHDRLRYLRQSDQTWQIERLSP